MLSDIQIAQACKMQPISEIAKKLDIDEIHVENYGKYKAKISTEFLNSVKDKKDGKLILVTAINPTPAGEGKTTTTVGLGQAMSKLGHKTVIALREPSLGPVFGVKGGAAGGGYAQVVPMEDINLHFTGDIHAVTTANNLLCALIDNHVHQGNKLHIDVRTILFKRVMDMNDRALRHIVISLGGTAHGMPRQDGFMISVASEVMAILCLATDLADLKERLGNILIAYTFEGKPVFARDIKAEGAMTALLKDAIKPNLVQTLEGTPCFMHGGPFANIAHGCNSITATRLALKTGDYVITEAGFGADLGAEKFFDIKCRKADLKPSCVVIVATIRALKYNGGVPKAELGTENVEALKLGSENLKAHIENISKFGVPVVVAINSFASDTDAETEYVRSLCEGLGAKYAVSRVFSDGGDGGIDLAHAVIESTGKPSNFAPLYKDDLSLTAKIETIAKEIYGAKGVKYSIPAKKELAKITEMGFGNLPICIAKTQYSLSDNPSLLGRPTGFNITVKSVRLAAGAGFVVCETGDIMTMPGLPKVPASENIDVDASGSITGLF